MRLKLHQIFFPLFNSPQLRIFSLATLIFYPILFYFVYAFSAVFSFFIHQTFHLESSLSVNDFHINAS